MMFKRFETKEDVIRQGIMAEVFINNMSTMPDLPHNIYKGTLNTPVYELIKCPDKYICDYIVTAKHGKCKAIIECKWRPTSWKSMEYRAYLSLHKLAGLIHMGNSLNVPVFFLMRVHEGLYYKLIEPTSLSRLSYTEGGRYDRGATDDIEPMGCIVEKYWDIYHSGFITNPCLKSPA